VAYILSIFTGLKNLGSLLYRGGAAKFFLNNRISLCNYSFNLYRCVEQNQQLVAHIWSKLVLLAVWMTCPWVPIKKRHLHRLVILPLPAWFHSVEAVCLRSGVNSPASTRHIGRTIFQCKFIVVLLFFLLIT